MAAARMAPTTRLFRGRGQRSLATNSSGASDVATQEFPITRQVTFCRPQKLNSLTLNMIRSLIPIYQKWSAQPSLPIMMVGEGDRAFCAGGDIQALLEDRALRRDFFLEEYQLDYLISQLPGPHVAIWRGVVMGGGVGVSLHGSHRIATDTSVFAMPEAAIGLFPDVGGSWALPRLQCAVPNLGLYLALTGTRLKGFELKEAGLATHFVPLARLRRLEERLRSIPSEAWPEDPRHARALMDCIIEEFQESTGQVGFAPQARSIASCFGGDTVEDIMARLQADGSLWATQTLAALQRCSPTSLKVTLEAQRRGAHLHSLAECLAMEYDVAQACMQDGSDFFEGVRATLIDKDQNPKWSPATLAEVPAVDHFFQPAAHGVRWFPLPQTPAAGL